MFEIETGMKTHTLMEKSHISKTGGRYMFYAVCTHILYDESLRDVKVKFLALYQVAVMTQFR
jgi:hypothetical protein